jgi:hypothetical protein
MIDLALTEQQVRRALGAAKLEANPVAYEPMEVLLTPYLLGHV